jgi:hypothetical protein
MPSQQGWPWFPHTSQVVPVQTEPGAVQKSLPRKTWQQASPTAPQLLQPEVAAEQVP